MRPPEDVVLLMDMLDHARRAISAARGRVREDLERDDLLAAGLERFIEVVGEAASKVVEGTRHGLPGIPWREIVGMRTRSSTATPPSTTTLPGTSCRSTSRCW